MKNLEQENEWGVRIFNQKKKIIDLNSIINHMSIPLL